MISTKELYLLTLISITTIYAVIFYLLWNHYKDKHGVNRLLLFVSMAFGSWAIVGLYKYSEPDFASIVNAVSDRVLSAFSNLFLIASLPYFPNVFKRVKEKYAFFENPEKWVFSVLVFFIVITTLFTTLERFFVDNKLVINTVIVFDSLLSSLAILLVSYALLKNIIKLWSSKPLYYFFVALVALFVLSQIYLPAVLIFSELLRPYYAYGLLSLLIGINTLGLLTLSFFGVYKMQSVKSVVSKTTDNLFAVSTSDEEVSLVGLELGYRDVEKVYFIKLTFSEINNKHQFSEEIVVSKILKPFANWVVFAIARKTNTKLSHNDMAITKFRMVEFWNKFADTKLNQDTVFHNDTGQFELKVSDQSITLINTEFLHSRFLIRTTLSEFITCFSQDQKELIKRHFPAFESSLK